MTEAEAVEAISQRFIDSWPTESSSVAYCFEGEALLGVDTFAMCSIVHAPTGKQMTQGAHPRVSRLGWIFVKLWTPALGGTKPRAQLADAARRVFERQRLGSGVAAGLTIKTGNTQEGGTDGRWMISAVRFGFSYFEQL